MTKETPADPKPTSTPEGKEGGEKPTQPNITTPEQELATSPGKKEGTDGGTNEESTFTQQQVNELLGKVRGEAKTAATKAMLTELGIESADTLKEKLQALSNIERENLTEQERLNADLTAAQTKIDELTTSSKEAADRSKTATINAEIARLAADTFGSVDAILKLVDRSDISIDESGNVVGVETALKSVEEQYPFTLRQAGVSITSPTNPANKDKPVSRTDEQRHAEYFGMNPEGPFWEGRGVKLIPED